MKQNCDLNFYKQGIPIYRISYQIFLMNQVSDIYDIRFLYMDSIADCVH